MVLCHSVAHAGQPVMVDLLEHSTAREWAFQALGLLLRQEQEWARKLV